VDSDDYRILPRNEYPKNRIEPIAGTGFVFGYSSTPQDATSVAGLWGYHDDYGNAWSDSGDTVKNTTQIAANGTTLTVTSGANFEVGQTIRMGSEPGYVSAITSNNLTIQRAQNGTTAAAHLNGVAIYIYRPMIVIREATRQLAAQIYKMKDSLPWGRIEYVDVGTIQMVAGVPEMVNRLTTYFRGIRV